MGKVNFKNGASGNTPINDINLNLMQEYAHENIGTNTDTYDSTKTYAVGDITIKDNQLYKCITAVTTAEEFDIAKWQKTSLMNMIEDTGWIDLPLAEGITQYATGRQYNCKYKKIGNHVWIIGCIKGIKANGDIIAQMPAGFRPVNQYRYITGHNTAYSDILAIGLDGKLSYVGTVNNTGTLIDTDFHYIQTDFLVN